MKIVCPQCSFLREVVDEKIPPKTQIATCPKCGHRFRFRTLPQEKISSGVEGIEEMNVNPAAQEETSIGEHHEADVPPSTTRHDDDIWDSLSALNPKPENNAAYEPHAHQTQQPGMTKKTSDGVPWEHLDTYGFFPGFTETIKQVMFHPVVFFRDKVFTPGMSKALVFYLLIAEIQALAQFFWKLTGIIPVLGDGDGGALFGLGMMGMGSAFILIFYPVFLTLALFIMVGINHIFLLIFSAASQGFAGTFRAITYGSAPMILTLIPVFGPLVGGVWTMLTTFLGYKYIHKTTTSRVVLAMLLPFVLLILLALMFASKMPAP